MKSIIRKLKLIFFVITCVFLSNFSLAIDPVEIGKFYQENIEVNLSIKISGFNEVDAELKYTKPSFSLKMLKSFFTVLSIFLFSNIVF